MAYKNVFYGNLAFMNTLSSYQSLLISLLTLRQTFGNLKAELHFKVFVHDMFETKFVVAKVQAALTKV